MIVCITNVKMAVFAKMESILIHVHVHNTTVVQSVKRVSCIYIYLENRAFLGIFSGGTNYEKGLHYDLRRKKNGFLEKFCIFKPPGLDFLQYQHLKGALVPSVSMFKKALLGNCLLSHTKIYLTICSFQTYIYQPSAPIDPSQEVVKYVKFETNTV